ncbi:sulfatase [Haloarchaeobius sp. HRN-SO-5]|uniref:sulfatase n=1 Tax=Haloarchaeobius sp. HRN-SO-5 TaxID=3446118 RepID=UPI003EBE7969
MDKNVVLLVMDTARAFDTRYVRETLSDSSLDRLATEGADFVNAFSNSPWTLPSHTSMFTGAYTSKHGTHAGHKYYEGQFPTLAELLKKEGYETVGITNNAWVTGEFGLSRGFDRFYKVWQYIQTDTDFGEIKLTSYGTDRLKEGLTALFSDDVIANVVNSIYGQFLYRRSDYGAKRTNRLARKWLSERNGDDPFFLFINYLEPHLDYQPPREFTEPFLEDGSYDEAMNVPQKPWEYVAGKLELSDSDLSLLQGLYRAEIAYLDEQIGELRATLEKEGEWEDTVFIVVGDHGENIGDHGLMDHQYSIHDTLIHVPLFVNGGGFDAVGESEELVQVVDLFPTILDIAEASIPDDSQGRSFHPNSTAKPREHVFAEYISPQPAIERLSEQTGVPSSELEKYSREIQAVRTNEHKFVRYSDGIRKLFDLDNNDQEQEDVLEIQRATAKELEAELDSWLSSFEHASDGEATEMSRSTKQRLEDLGYLQ